MRKSYWLLCLAVLVLPAGAQSRVPAVEADFETLRAVIVMSIDESIYKSSEMGTSIHPIFNKGLPPGTIREHRQFVNRLRKNGVRVLQVRDLLQDAIDNARKKGELERWIRDSFPNHHEEARRHLEEIDADGLLHRSDSLFYRKNDAGELNPLFPSTSSMYWSRDFAASTPKGIIIGNGQAYGRSLENAIARLMFQYATALREFPVVFDAAPEGVQLDGGDLIVQDDKTLLLGVGQRSDEKAAPLLAAKLGMDVIAVRMPPRDKPNGMSRQLLHLDSIFNFVDRDKIVAVPYFLEKDFSNTNPMAKILTGLAAQTDGILAGPGKGRSGGDSKQIRLTVELMPEVGWLTRYAAGTGEATLLQMKLVDYFRNKGFRIIYAGGEPGPLPAEKYALERAMYELRWQGVNVAQLGPGRVMAYRHNGHTNAALRQAGVKVYEFDGDLLSLRNGGPHCLMMPLIRQH